MKFHAKRLWTVQRFGVYDALIDVLMIAFAP